MTQTKKQFAILWILLAISTTVRAQVISVNCTFIVISTYTCSIVGITILDQPDAIFLVGGEHLEGFSNDDVERISISQSNIPFVITQLFTTFPNASSFVTTNSGLIRIQSKAFTNATKLTSADFIDNQQFTTIHEDAFEGAENLELLILQQNHLATIHENAFNGLVQLRQLYLDSNRLRELPAGVFQSLTSLEVLFFSNNLFESLHGSLLAHNQNLLHLEFPQNHINAVGRGFFNSLKRLQFLNTAGNDCTNGFWMIDGTTTLETVRQEFETCFDNFIDDPANVLRRFVLEFRGPLSIYFENGTEIIQI